MSSAIHSSTNFGGKFFVILGIAIFFLQLGPATAAINTITFFNANLTDQISLEPTVEYSQAADSDFDQVSGDTEAAVHGSLVGPFQTHQYSMTAVTAKNLSGSKPVSMKASHSHEFDMRGLDGSALWYYSETVLNGSSTFSDSVSLVGLNATLPDLLTVEYFFRLTAFNSQVIDIAVEEQPLYRLEDHITFSATAGGLEMTPLSFDETFYDTHARPPIETDYSVLEEDVTFFNKQLIPASQQIQSIKFELPRVIESGNISAYLADFSASMQVESTHKFLNDGPGLNLFLRGEITLDFSNSADVLGILVQDESGAIRTDIEVTSAEGVTYPVLSAPITNVPPQAGSVMLSPVSVHESGLGAYSADVSLENMIDRSGLTKPMLSGITPFDVYLFEGEKPTSDSDYHHYWQSEVSLDGQFSGSLDFDLGDEYLVDRVAIWNGTLENIELSVATSPDGPWQAAGAFTLQNQNPLLFGLIEPEVLDLDGSIRMRYLRLAVLSAYPYLRNEDFEYAILRELGLSVSPAPQPQDPVLSLRAEPSSIILGWSTSAVGFELQSARTLAGGGDWQNVDGVATVDGDQNRVTIERDPTIGALFFRLRKP